MLGPPLRILGNQTRTLTVNDTHRTEKQARRRAAPSEAKPRCKTDIRRPRPDGSITIGQTSKHAKSVSNPIEGNLLTVLQTNNHIKDSFFVNQLYTSDQSLGLHNTIHKVRSVTGQHECRVGDSSHMLQGWPPPQSHRHADPGPKV